MSDSRRKFVLFCENNLPFSPLFGMQCHCGRGLGATRGLQKPESSRCSEMHSQPYLRPFSLVCRAIVFCHGVRAQLFFSLIIRAQLFFSKNFRAQLFFSILYTL